MVDTPSGSSPTRPSARRSSGAKAVPRFRIGIASTAVPRARTRSTGPSRVLRNSYGREVMGPWLLASAWHDQDRDRRLPYQRRGDRAEQDATDRAVAPGAADQQVDAPLADHRELVDHLAVEQLTGRLHPFGEFGEGPVQRLLVFLAHLDGDGLLLGPDDLWHEPVGMDADDRVQGEGQARPCRQVGGVADGLVAVGGVDEGHPTAVARRCPAGGTRA